MNAALRVPALLLAAWFAAAPASAQDSERNRTDLYKLLQRHELRPERFKTED